MNFEKIKQHMDDQDMEDLVIPQQISALKSTQLPLQKIRRNLRNEIITQMVVILIFFMIPGFTEMAPMAKGLYFILIFITSLITTTYLIKMNGFLRRSTNLSLNAKEVLVNVIYELRLTLEVYKTAIISGSLLLPFILFVVIYGKSSIENSHLNNLLTLNIPFKTLILYIIGYLFISILIYGITIWWTNLLYGKYIRDLENSLEKIGS